VARGEARARRHAEAHTVSSTIAARDGAIHASAIESSGTVG
jgi:hypothetical protein